MNLYTNNILSCARSKSQDGNINDHGDEYKGQLVANFSSNVWFGANHRELYNHLSMHLHLTQRYPEQHCDTLRNELGNYLGLQAEELMINNGSIEGIYLLAQAYREKKSLIISPTFSEYAKACRLNAHKILTCKASELENSILENRPDLVWICTPNNPDGFTFEISFLKKLVLKFPKTIFIFDVSFKEYCLSVQPDSHWGIQFPNVYILYSFTKRYGIPGLRIGYISGNKINISRINGIPWSVNTLASEALKHLIHKHTDDYNIEQWLESKNKFTDEINALDNFECLQSQTPFFIVKLKNGQSSDLKEYLLEKKILIRDATTFYLDGQQYIRLLTLTNEQNRLLIQELKKWELQLSLLHHS